jgi:hypothetical protein
MPWLASIGTWLASGPIESQPDLATSRAPILDWLHARQTLGQQG